MNEKSNLVVITENEWKSENFIYVSLRKINFNDNELIWHIIKYYKVM